MRIKSKHKIILKAFGFVLLVVSMFILNNSNQKDDTNLTEQSAIEMVNSAEGTVAATATIPYSTEHSLPIKLLSNTKANFLFFVNRSNDKIRITKYLQRKQMLLDIQTHIESFYFIQKYITAKNKEIQ